MFCRRIRRQNIKAARAGGLQYRLGKWNYQRPRR
jgi:hypothetical protein